jgi:hypothetical protein
MASGGRAENAALADDELADAVGGTDLGDELGDLRVPVAAVAANDQSAVLDALGDGEEDAGDEGLAVVWLLEDPDLLAQARPDYVSSTLERPLNCKTLCSTALMEHLRSRLLVGERRDFYGFDVHGSYDGRSEMVEKQCEGSIEKSDWERRRRRFPVVTDGGFAPAATSSIDVTAAARVGRVRASHWPITRLRHPD